MSFCQAKPKRRVNSWKEMELPHSFMDIHIFSRVSALVDWPNGLHFYGVLFFVCFIVCFFCVFLKCIKYELIDWCLCNWCISNEMKLNEGKKKKKKTEKEKNGFVKRKKRREYKTEFTNTGTLMFKFLNSFTALVTKPHTFRLLWIMTRSKVATIFNWIFMIGEEGRTW